MRVFQVGRLGKLYVHRIRLKCATTHASVEECIVYRSNVLVMW